ncbi:MAG: secondary thiamine-phosphate synthase enzyme YjbQ [Anaerolineae bacterium]|jgi:secondary thiamine-phosphate synthase enzyme
MLTELHIQTAMRSEMIDITPHVHDVVGRSGVDEGVCHVYVLHTTAGVTLNENWDPSVRDDVLRTLEQLVPRMGDYRHAEGNSPAHIKAILTGFTVTIPITEGEMVLGSWQGIFLAEYDGPRSRRVMVKIIEG